jgi:hypothetical protein
MQVATNFMGHFARTIGLHDALADAPRRSDRVPCR